MPARRAAAPAGLKRSPPSRQSSSVPEVSPVKLGTIRYSCPSRWAISRLRFHPTNSEIGEMCAEGARSEEHTSELQSPCNLVCRLLLEKKKRSTIWKYRANLGNGPCHTYGSVSDRTT